MASSFSISTRKLTLNEQIGAFVSRDATTVQLGLQWANNKSAHIQLQF